MAKQPIKRLPLKPEKPSKPLIPEKYQDLFFIGMLIIAVYVFFAGALAGGGFNVSDNQASISFRPFVAEANKSGNFPLWMPYIFCGMPGYSALLLTGARLWDFAPMILFKVTEFIGAVFNNDLGRVASYYAIFAVGMYLLMRFKEHVRFVSFFTAFAATFSTSVIVWVMIGHNTKPLVFAMFPYIFIILEKLRLKFSLVYSVLLIFAVHIMMEAGHLQMIFYGICAFGLYLLFEFISRLISKQEPMKVIRTAVILAAAGGIAFVMSADRYLSTLEYTSYSTRGSAPISKTDKQHQDASGGNDYSYATMWSFSPQEVMTFFVPSYFGFGQRDYKGPATNEESVKISGYWGQKESEDAPPYMGIIVLGLGLLGMVLYRKDVFVQFLIALVIFSLFLSFGKNLPVLYDIFYKLIPSFNKFRAPSMALALTQFSFPILAGYGLSGLLKWRKDLTPENKKLMNYLMIASGVFLVLAPIFTALFKTSYMEAMTGSRIGKQYPEEIHNFIWSEMISDWYLTAFIAVVAAGMIYLYVKRNITPFLFFGGMAVLLVFDLWRVDYRPMDYSKKSVEQEVFVRTDMIDFLKQDNSVYRVADFAYPSPNTMAYFLIENCNGYHSAKMRLFQDMMDVADRGSTSNVTNPFLWNLMNVKYLITREKLGGQPIFRSQQTGFYVYPNPQFLPRAFFVDSVQVAKQIDILNHLKTGDFNPKKLAYIEKELPVKIDAPIDGVEAKITQKRNEYLKIEAMSSGNNLLFISEMYYPAGWKAYVDGKEAEIYKTNFAFRSVIVPRGTHTIEMKFSSAKFQEGKNMSLATNLIVLAILVVGIFLERKGKKKENNEEVHED